MPPFRVGAAFEVFVFVLWQAQLIIPSLVREIEDSTQSIPSRSPLVRESFRVP